MLEKYRIYTKWFSSFSFFIGCSGWQKNSQEDRVKTSVENFLSLKLARFYLREINNLLDKRLEVIKNNDEYTID